MIVIMVMCASVAGIFMGLGLGLWLEREPEVPEPEDPIPALLRSVPEWEMSGAPEACTLKAEHGGFEFLIEGRWSRSLGLEACQEVLIDGVSVGHKDVGAELLRHWSPERVKAREDLRKKNELIERIRSKEKGALSVSEGGELSEC